MHRRESLPADADLIRIAREGIEALNQKYQSDRSDIFFLFHRPRRWNAQEGAWMGYERKRGKLTGMVERAAAVGSRIASSEIVGDVAALSEVRYVITLDTDTQLPRDSARQMVGAMAHALNRPIFDAKRQRVVDGYGILQPRVGVSLPSSQGSWFTRLFAGDAGVDPYTRVVSDVYQDLFREGSFIGKGIYDVDAFQQACGQLPENAILSHDLLESAYARSALISDVELFEEFPSSYATDLSRRHRWMRGDWQIAPWLLPRVAARAGEKTPLSAISWWKIFDNLRRSLVPIGLLILLLGGWLTLDRPLAAASALLAATRSGHWRRFPLMRRVLPALVRKPRDVSLLLHLRLTARALGKKSLHVLFTLIFLASDAWISLDAIARSLLRVSVTKRKLLEWTTSSDAERSQRTDIPGFFRTMWLGPVIAAGVAFLVCDLLRHGRSRDCRGRRFRCSWRLWAIVAAGCLVAQPSSHGDAAISVRLLEKQRQFLQKLARRTWRYFEVFVTAEENWLPPDNVQERLSAVVAPRTSPTNIGIALLANLAAYDFGYCSAAQLLDRTAKTFQSLAKMERHRGHFLNWYDTRTLQPLSPRYVSMVDSGNLAGHLFVLRSGLAELIHAPVFPGHVFGGLRDTLGVLLDTALGQHVPADQRERGLVPPHVIRQMERLQQVFGHPPDTLGEFRAAASRCCSGCWRRQLRFAPGVGDDPEVRWWAAAFEQSLYRPS